MEIILLFTLFLIAILTTVSPLLVSEDTRGVVKLDNR